MKNISIVVDGFKEAVENNVEILGFERVEDYPSKAVKRAFLKDKI